ncbi:MAG: hypothetical protein LBN39_07750 [Planctomycetaceae bacterium]|jgi:hypothetical protein|nr:hypothetical protein [Planctomycetaceae bacterium]
MNRETLLGYLMNALEDGEMSSVEQELLRQPKLREQLAELQREISPLASVNEMSDPPKYLAEKTCNKIWAAAGKDELYRGEFDTAGFNTGEDTVISMPMFAERNRISDLPSDRSDMLQAILAASPKIESANTEDVEKIVKRLKRNVPQPAVRKPVPHFYRKYDIAAAFAVGILAALLVFPALNGSTVGQKEFSMTQTPEPVAASQVLSEPEQQTAAVLDSPMELVDSGADYVPLTVPTPGRDIILGDIILGQTSDLLLSHSIDGTKNGWQNISFSTPDIANQAKIFRNK